MVTNFEMEFQIVSQSLTKKLSSKIKKNTLPSATSDTRQSLLCRLPGQLAVDKEPAFADCQMAGTRQRGR